MRSNKRRWSMKKKVLSRTKTQRMPPGLPHIANWSRDIVLLGCRACREDVPRSKLERVRSAALLVTDPCRAVGSVGIPVETAADDGSTTDQQLGAIDSAIRNLPRPIKYL
ncbi:MAG: hypothetical protein M1818_008402 [Claussenomyces sp. TS43310]|nr:MAG: hypothetical protein M1818_008402 [Claussenomyces sp. TS43310]